MQRIYHLLLSTHPGLMPLRNPDLCARLWQRLQIRFPSVWACVLMPDHIHLILETSRPRVARRILAIEARAACRIYFPGDRIWARSPEPECIPNSLHLKRTIRYVHLNPCREGLARDPLEWEWSTHRDVLGVTRKSWVDLGRLAEVFRASTSKPPELFHAYVSGDPSVSVSGTSPLRRLRPGDPLTASPSMCIWAIAAVSRASLGEVTQRGQLRDLAIQLAISIARNSRASVIQALGIDERTVRRALSRPQDTATLTAACQFLADPRCYKIRRGE